MEKYIIIKADTVEELETKVNVFIRENTNYKPVGDITRDAWHDQFHGVFNVTYYQPVFRDK